MNRPDPAPNSLPAHVLGLCLLRGGPQDLPYSPGLLIALLVASTLLDVLLGSGLAGDPNAFARSALSSLVILGLCWVALALRELRNRYLQTATAIVATSMAFTLVQGFVLLVGGMPPATTPATAGQMLIAWLLFAVFLWQLVVIAHIVRHATEMRPGFALALVVAWIIAWWAIERIVFGAG